MPIIKTENLHFTYAGDEHETLHGIDLEIEEGSFVAILGHNGSGKSTLAKLFNGILLPNEGRVLVDGIDTTHEDKLLDDGLADNTFASGSTGESVSVTGTVQRVAGELNNGSTVYYLILTEEPQRIFAASSSLSPELALTQPGDQVTLSYLSSGAAAQEVTAFDNLLFSQDGSAPASQPAQEAAQPAEEPAA